MSLIDSKITQSSVQILYNVLTQTGYYITGLSFKYSFLDTRSIYMISKALEINRSLVKLDLSGNGLSPIMGVYLAKSLKNNVTLTELNLEKNCLNDDFAEELAELLKKNDILWKVDISYNPIGDIGARALLKAIRENNDTLESLGDDFYSNSPSMGVITVQEILKVLKQNKVSKEIRSKLLSEGM
jgi:Ran GTPase-activating protein (RanGAP) involved in mRNA processing and transport